MVAASYPSPFNGECWLSSPHSTVTADYPTPLTFTADYAAPLTFTTGYPTPLTLNVGYPTPTDDD